MKNVLYGKQYMADTSGVDVAVGEWREISDWCCNKMLEIDNHYSEA